jgi:protein O-mannosyl-transferase
MNLSKLRTILGLFVVFFALGLFVQHAGLHAPMYYDSAGNIAEKEAVFAHEGLRGVMSLFPQRPLPTATFFLNYLVGGVNPVLYRVFNVGLLAGASLLVVWLVRLILDIPANGSRPTETVKTVASLFAGLVFLIHPVQIYVTLYIWQRMALMACLFSYACLAVYLAVRTGRWPRPLIGYTLCSGLFVCAVLSKENSIFVPAILVLAEVAFFPQSWTALAKRACLFGLVTLGLLAGISVLQHPHGNTQLGTGIMATITQYYAESGLTLAQVVYTQSRVVFSYLSLIVFPVPSSVQLIAPQVLSLSLIDPPVTAAAMAGVFGMIAAGLYLLKRVPVWGFGLIFFLVGLLPEGLLVPQYAFFGYRAVLPMFGILLVAADCLARFLDAVGDLPRWRILRASVMALLAGGIICLGICNALRADLWSDPLRFWKATVAAFPEEQDHMERKVASHALGNAGAALYAAERYAEAVDYYERAIAASPGDPRKMVSLAAVYAEMGSLLEAETLLQRTIANSPNFVTAYKNLGIVLMKGNKLDQALDALRQGLKQTSHDDSLYEVMGQVQLMQRDVSAAIASFGQAVALNPRSAGLRFQLGQALLAQGNAVAAKESLRKAVELKPDYWEAYNSLGIVYANEGKHEEAYAHFREALALDPGNPQLQANVQTAAKHLQGRPEKGRQAP